MDLITGAPYRALVTNSNGVKGRVVKLLAIYPKHVMVQTKIYGLIGQNIDTKDFLSKWESVEPTVDLKNIIC